MRWIGSARRLLFLPGSWRWNAWVRDVTAWIEGWLSVVVLLLLAGLDGFSRRRFSEPNERETE